ncbi:MAG: hypothetical protein HRT89_21265 [Lentisphaeria bacterium]|nr:hypothetical protein [Lentisphaeria bacterium]NQZ70591.1 hypothetical protein [Lentisphaeria bacterium]
MSEVDKEAEDRELEPVPMPGEKTRRISWRGISFLVPANWEIGLFKFLKKGGNRIELEDEYATRLEAEWIYPKEKIDRKIVEKRYKKKFKKLTDYSDKENRISDLPTDWYATSFELRHGKLGTGETTLMQKKQQLLTAFYIPSDNSIFISIVVHIFAEDAENPADVVKLISSEFQIHNKDALIPWELYDMYFKMPKELQLDSTQFDIGSKLMLYRWKMRTLYLWHFSLADHFIDDEKTAEEYGTGFLNSMSFVRAVTFSPGLDGEITWKRKRWHVFGRRDEFACMCFKYKAAVVHDKEENKLILICYHYRKNKDLKLLNDFIEANPYLASAKKLLR